VSFQNFQVLTFICNYLPHIILIILQTLKFKALLFVYSFASSSSSIACQPQEFVISFDPSIPIVDLSIDDGIFNPITTETQLPWKGPKEKSKQLM
jgi:hypothetical protein